MKIDVQRVNDGLWEWAKVSDGDECAWQNIEKCTRAIVQMLGFGNVEIRGSLFEGDGEIILRLVAAQPIVELPFIPWRVRPVVHDGEATIRLYIPRGQ